MSLVLAKLFYRYDVELVDPDIDWEARSRHWIMWWKAPLYMRAHKRPECA